MHRGRASTSSRHVRITFWKTLPFSSAQNRPGSTSIHCARACRAVTGLPSAFTERPVRPRFSRGWMGSMFRVRLFGSTAALALSAAALAGCSSSPSWMPDWMSFSRSAPPLVTMQFESQPPGADVRTSQGQSCQTPCSLALQPQSQVVSFSKNGFLPQSVQVVANEPADHSFFESAPPPTLSPNPVDVVLQPAAPPPRMRPPMKPRPRPHRPPAPPPGSAPPPPAEGQPSPFPPPPGQ
jgi:hypothetical protein